MRSLSRIAALLALLLTPPLAGAAEPGGEECYTVQLFGYDEIIIAPALDDAVGIVVGVPVVGRGLGVTLLVRPGSCGVLLIATTSGPSVAAAKPDLAPYAVAP